MPERDPNDEALEQVEKATESEPTKSKDLLESEDLERKVGDSKKRITNDNTSRPTSQRDLNKEALEQVEKATDSEPVKGEELLGLEDLKRKLREDPEKRASPANFQFYMQYEISWRWCRSTMAITA